MTGEEDLRRRFFFDSSAFAFLRRRLSVLDCMVPPAGTAPGTSRREQQGPGCRRSMHPSGGWTPPGRAPRPRHEEDGHRALVHGGVLVLHIATAGSLSDVFGFSAFLVGDWGRSCLCNWVRKRVALASACPRSGSGRRLLSPLSLRVSGCLSRLRSLPESPRASFPGCSSSHLSSKLSSQELEVFSCAGQR